jgi:outer membrane protein assembly factor BamA
VRAIDYTDKDFKNIISYPTQTADSFAAINATNKILSLLFAKGYVHAHINSILSTKDSTVSELFVGKVIRWGRIAVPEEVLASRELSRVKSLTGRIVSINELDIACNQVLKYYENNGYPFASIRLKSIIDEENKLTADLIIERGKLIICDSLAIVGDITLTNRYIRNYIGIKKDAIYSEELVRNIPQKIRELPFIELVKQPIVNFYAGKAIITLYLKKRNANRFDFIIGVLPNSSLLNTSGKVLITGDVQLNLQNALGYGEQLSLRFEKFQARTTRAKSRVVYPYLLSTPFGIDAGFNLFVNDSVFRNLEYDIGLQYLYTGGNYIKGYYKRFETRVISIDTAVVLFTKKLPSNLDVNNSTYGIEYAYDKTDFRFNPRKGYGFILNVAVGLRRIEPNLKIINLKDPFNPEYSFRTLYDSIQNKGNQYRATLKFYKFWPIANHAVIKTQFDAGYIIGQNIVVGELFRLGGNKFLRGFDEESILVSSYNVLNIEYRVLLDQYSFISAFSDWGLINRFSGGSSYSVSFPTGFGAGFTFQTRAGLFNVSYALGRTEVAPVSFRAAKIHFGYINIF